LVREAENRISIIGEAFHDAILYGRVGGRVVDGEGTVEFPGAGRPVVSKRAKYIYLGGDRSVISALWFNLSRIFAKGWD
jgi:hypothetical protein